MSAQYTVYYDIRLYHIFGKRSSQIVEKEQYMCL